MSTHYPATLVPFSAMPFRAAAAPMRRGGFPAAPIPWQEDVGAGSSGSRPAGGSKGGTDAGWLGALERVFGTCVRMIPVNAEPPISGVGPVCRALDGLCGRRALCNQTHGTMHASAAQSGRVQLICCPLGFSLASIPVRAKETCLGQLEFGPFCAEQVDWTAFEINLRQLGFPLSVRARLQVPLSDLRTIRGEDVEGVLALVERVASVIAEGAVQAPVSAAVPDPAAVAAGREYAELHIGDRIALADVARHVALSPDHFSRLFRNATGISFGEYVNGRRVANAQRLLCETSQRVAEISYACGFDSVPHFNRVFRRIAGTSPTRYRRQARCR